MHLSRVFAVTGVIALLISASPSASAATGGAATSAAKWTAIEAPLPANADHTFAQLNSVACPSASKCIAVGSYTGSAGTQGLLLTKSGSSWTAAQAPAPAGAAADPNAGLESTSCFSASVCTAIGSYTDSSGDTEWELLTTSGSSWTAAEAPLPADAASNPGAGLSAVHCASTASCLAVGSYEDSVGDREGLLITGFGTQWTATQASVPSDAAADPDTGLDSVTCTGSTGGCVTVGDYDSSNGYEGLILAGSGSSWTATKAPGYRVGGTYPEPGLAAVRCLSPSSCTAVGSYDDWHGGLLVTGSGTSWHAAKAPQPPNTSHSWAWLSAVACPGPSACIAAGTYHPFEAGWATMLVKASASSLAVSEAALPSGASKHVAPDLATIACASASACVAVGQYRQVDHDRGLLVYGGGTSWTAIQAPVPHNAGGNKDIPSVSCPKNASTCIAVGTYVKSGNDQGLLLTGPA